MPYKNSSTIEFKGKGFVDPDRLVFISVDKKDAGFEYDLKEIFSTVGQGEEVQFSVKRTNVDESITPLADEE